MKILTTRKYNSLINRNRHLEDILLRGFIKNIDKLSFKEGLEISRILTKKLKNMDAALNNR